MTGEHRLWYDRPAQRWTEALPLGNGRLGAMVWGGVDEETISLNEGTLWSGYPEGWYNDGVPVALAECRELLRQGRQQEAQAIVEGRMAGRWTQAYLPLGRLRCRSNLGPGTPSYRRHLDLRSAIAGSQGTFEGLPWERESFVSAPAQVFVSRLTTVARTDHRITLESDLAGRCTVQPDGLRWSGVAPRFVAPSYFGSQEPIVYGTTPETSGMRCGFQCRVVTDGQVLVGDGEISVVGSRTLTLVVAGATSFVDRSTHPFVNGANEGERLEALLEGVRGRSYENLREEHLADHRRLYDRAGLEFPGTDPRPTDARLQAAAPVPDPGLAALAFHYGRYLLVAGSRPGGQPLPLQGLWNEDLRPAWSANYTTNINAEMNYWPAEVTNLAECHRPFLDFIGDAARNGAAVARRHYGARGWAAHHNLDIWAHPIPAGDDGSWFPGSACHLFWPLGGAWLAHHLWEYYAFGQDLGFLETTAWPVLREAARFCLDWLCEGADGTLTTMPSTSPENRYLDAEGRSCSVDVGTTADIASIRELFLEVCRASDLLGQDQDFVDQVRAALARLPGYRTTPTGALAEWSQDFQEEEPGHRHFSHLYGLYPGTQIGRSSPRWTGAAAQAIAQRLDHGGAGTGWSLAWLLCLQARLGDGRGAELSLGRWLTDSVFANLFDLHPTQEGHPGVFQIDGNFGVTAGIAELLVQSQGDEVLLLPALPPSWPEGRVWGLRVRGDAVVSLEWSKGALVRASLVSGRPTRWTLRYRDAAEVFKAPQGGTVTWAPSP